MRTAWRIVKDKHAATAFTGEGAAKTGGRWNSKGVAVVYVSSTKSLAALENLVHLNPPVLFKYVAIRIEFEDTSMEQLPFDSLPANWREEPPPASTRQLGDSWVRAHSSAVLAVPSVIISGELNYLFNPAHPDFALISIGKPEPFSFAPRLIG